MFEAGSRRRRRHRGRRDVALSRRQSEQAVDLDGVRPGRLIDWECGGRDRITFERLLARLRRWNIRLICTDEDAVYQQSLPVGWHYAGKDQTVALEGAHSRLRHWLTRFRRRTCVVAHPGFRGAGSGV